MRQLLLSQLAAATGGRIRGGDFTIGGYSSDTRKISRDDLYFCLPGDRFDGHDFVSDAIEKGAGAIVCERETDTDLPQLIVSDARRAFGLYAMLWREQFDNPVVGVTGSNGKTTVKQLLASIFMQAGNVHATRANDNNEIGVPQTLLGLSEDHDFVVVEMGASDRGEIKWLGQLVKPTISVINNASAAHLQGFGDAESVASEKAWIYKSLSSDGVAVVNAADEFCDFWLKICAGLKVITFGSSGDVTVTRNDDGSIVVSFAGKNVSCNYKLPGKHNLENAAAAAACAIAAGLSLDKIAAGLSSAVAVSGRLNFIDLTDGITLIDDTYNANPASTRAAIDVLTEFSGKRVVVLGDLLELGDRETELHTSIGVYARTAKIDRLFTFGELSKHTASAFGSGGQWYQDKNKLIEALSQELCGDTCVLVKGSRSMKMEEVVAEISDRFDSAPAGVCCQ